LINILISKGTFDGGEEIRKNYKRTFN
jgi:hypothetical protein